MRSVLSIFDCPSELCYSKFFLEAAATEIQHTYAYVCLYFCVCVYIYGCMHTWVIYMNILVVESKFFSKQKAAPETEKELEEKERIIAI